MIVRSSSSLLIPISKSASPPVHTPIAVTLKNLEMKHPESPQRFIIKVSVQNIPGDPSARPFSLQEIFSEKVLQRPPRLEVCADGFDAVHIPPDFDTGNDVRRWFIVDTGVTGNITRDDIHKIPLKAYLGRLDDNNEL